MGPKPRQTIARPLRSAGAVGSVGAGSSSASATGRVRGRRWVYSRASLVMLLLLQPFCLVFGFVLLTEPCLNASYKNSLWDKRNYLTLLTNNSILASEWTTRFTSAGLKSLFGTLVIQAWFTARLNAYLQAASHNHKHLIESIKDQKSSTQIPKLNVPSFIRQLESVSLSLLLTIPLATITSYAVILLLGAPLDHFKQSATLAAHIALIVFLPILHVTGSAKEVTPTDIVNAHTFAPKLLAAIPSPSFLWPLFYPPLFTIATTLLATATLALDWNTAWQTYPFPLLVASLLGLTAGNAYTIILILFT